MKKDVYEHLAKTFLEKKQKRNVTRREILQISGIILTSFFILSVIFGFIFNKKVIFSKKLYAIQDKMPVDIKYDFTAPGISKVRSIAFDLDHTNLSNYAYLNLAIKSKQQSSASVATVKIQFENSRLEKDSKYISGISSKWNKFRISLKDFKLISDWKDLNNLTFIVEDWNVSNKNDGILIDDIYFSQ